MRKRKIGREELIEGGRKRGRERWKFLCMSSLRWTKQSNSKKWQSLISSFNPSLISYCVGHSTLPSFVKFYHLSLTLLTPSYINSHWLYDFLTVPCSPVTVKTEWDRDDPSFMPVAAVALFKAPESESNNSIVIVIVIDVKSVFVCKKVRVI